MRKSRFREEQIVAALRHSEAGASVEEIIRRLGLLDPPRLRRADCDHGLHGRVDTPVDTDSRFSVYQWRMQSVTMATDAGRAHRSTHLRWARKGGSESNDHRRHQEPHLMREITRPVAVRKSLSGFEGP